MRATGGHHHTIPIRVPEGGLELDLDCGLNIYVYFSEARGKFVVELETGDAADQNGLRVVEHDELERPRMTVMVNEAEVSDD